MLGAVTFPAYTTGDTDEVINKKCATYAAARAVEVAGAGVTPSLDAAQADIDACKRSMAQSRSGTQLVAFLSIMGLGALGYHLWKHR